MQHRQIPRRERGRLIEKKQLGPAPAAHHLAPPAPEVAQAGKPCPARPAPRQCFRRGIVDDAAIAGEHSAMRRGDDVAGWGDPILQRHFSSPSPRARGEGRDEGDSPRIPSRGEPPPPPPLPPHPLPPPRRRGQAARLLPTPPTALPA